jgi:hypothetical protein
MYLMDSNLCCAVCGYATNDGSNWRRHIRTVRHLDRIRELESAEAGPATMETAMGTAMESAPAIPHSTATTVTPTISTTATPAISTPAPPRAITAAQFACNCGKSYRYRSGLSHHRKSCSDAAVPRTTSQATSRTTSQATSSTTSPAPHHPPAPEQSYIAAFMEVMKLQMAQQQEQTELVREMMTNLDHGGVVNNTTTNNQFNLNVFLNEDCKNALNLSEFLDSIQVEVSDLDYTKTHLLENGLRNIIVNALGRIGATERPFQCTDKKRRTLYVKHDGQWERDTRETNHQLLKDGIGVVQMKQIDHIKQWAVENPSYEESGPVQKEFVKLARVCTERLTDVQTSRIIGGVADATYIKHNTIAEDPISTGSISAGSISTGSISAGSISTGSISDEPNSSSE